MQAKIVISALLGGHMALAHATPPRIADVWSNIESSAYDQLPDIKAPSGTANMLCPSYASESLAPSGDDMPDGRKKIIHTFGVAAKFRLDFTGASNPFTGVFAFGSQIDGIIRISVARPMAENDAGEYTRYMYGAGIKLFPRGSHEPLNIAVMPSLDGQAEPNAFTHTYSNIVAAPNPSVTTFLLDKSFTWAKWRAGAVQTNPRILELDQMAGVTANSEDVASPTVPYRMNLVPTADARWLMQSASTRDDFRKVLSGQGSGVELFTIDLISLDSDGQEMTPIFAGTLTLTSDFVASEYSDTRLWFPHFVVTK